MAERIQIESLDLNEGSLRAYPLEGNNSPHTEETSIKEYPFLEHDFYPGEWVIVFEYWNTLAPWELQAGQTCIALHQGKDQYIFLEDTPWNWQKVQWFTQGSELENLFSQETTETLVDYLRDPDVAMAAYHILNERGEMNPRLILQSFRDSQIDYSQFRISFNHMGFVYQHHLELLEEDEQLLLIEETISFLWDDYLPILAWMLDYELEQRQYRPAEHFVDYCMVFFHNSESFRDANSTFYSLGYLYEQGVSLEILEPAFLAWATLLPSEEDFNRQSYPLENLFQDQLNPQDQYKLLRSLLIFLNQNPRRKDYRGLIDDLPGLIEALPEGKKEALIQEMREDYREIAELLPLSSS